MRRHELAAYHYFGARCELLVEKIELLYSQLNRTYRVFFELDVQVGLFHAAFKAEDVIVLAENDCDLTGEAHDFGIDLSLRSAKLNFQINVIELHIGPQSLKDEQEGCEFQGLGKQS